MSIRIENTTVRPVAVPRSPWAAMARGLRKRCPACGVGKIYTAYLKVADACPSCGTELHHQRADDAPPYFTMIIVAHVVVGGMLMLERAYAPDSLVHMMIWVPLTICLSLWLLPMVKGALIALQWALRMHGFGEGPDPAAPEPIANQASKHTGIERKR